MAKDKCEVQIYGMTEKESCIEVVWPVQHMECVRASCAKKLGKSERSMANEKAGHSVSWYACSVWFYTSEQHFVLFFEFLLFLRFFYRLWDASIFSFGLNFFFAISALSQLQFSSRKNCCTLSSREYNINHAVLSPKRNTLITTFRSRFLHLACWQLLNCHALVIACIISCYSTAESTVRYINRICT